MGSKNRFSKELKPILTKNRKKNQYYVEPFAGGMNMIDKISGLRIANDNNKYLISMWKGLLSGRERPLSISKEFYSDVRDCFNGKNQKYDNFLVGWVGFMGSANGRFFEGGYSGKSITKNGKVRDYISESIRNIEKQLPNLNGVEFQSSDYTDMIIPPNSIIYCDIPYYGTKKYYTSKNFDYDKFWQWCRVMTLSGHEVYVSEYNAPKDFKCIWEKSNTSSLKSNSVISGSKKSIEKLFVFDKEYNFKVKNYE